MILLLTLLLITLKAFLDAYRHECSTYIDTPKAKRQRRISDGIDFFFKVFVPVIALAWVSVQGWVHVRETRLWVLLIGYALVWFATFDQIYNIIRPDVDQYYVGVYKTWDRFLRSLKLHPTLLIFSRLIAFIWGASWLLGWKDGIIPFVKSIF